MPWLFQKTVARKSRSAVCPNLRALHDAERKELLRQTKEYEALRFLKDGKNQGSKSCVSILPKAVSYTHLTLPTSSERCRSRWSPYH